MQVHIEQQFKEEDTIQNSILWIQLGFWLLDVDAIHVGYNIKRMNLGNLSIFFSTRKIDVKYS